MAWQQNLFNNLLVIFILLTLAIIIYCKVRNRSLVDFFREVKEIMSPRAEVIDQ